MGTIFEFVAGLAITFVASLFSVALTRAVARYFEVSRRYVYDVSVCGGVLPAFTLGGVLTVYMSGSFWCMSLPDRLLTDLCLALALSLTTPVGIAVAKSYGVVIRDIDRFFDRIRQKNLE